MERGLIMLLHSMLIGIFIYVFMIYLGQSQIMAENRSILISALILVYMILFGHGLPISINKNLI
jgi:TRAP-type C4-dicarboxylate transport system permease small subunit